MIVQICIFLSSHINFSEEEKKTHATAVRQLLAHPCYCLSDAVKIRVSESSGLAISRYLSLPLCQPLACNLCFHTLGAVCLKRWHWHTRESFCFHYVDGCTLINRNAAKLSAPPRPPQVFEQKKRE